MFNHYLRITPPQSPLQAESPPAPPIGKDRTPSQPPLDRQPSSFSSYASSASSTAGGFSASAPILPPFPTPKTPTLQASPARQARSKGSGDRDRDALGGGAYSDPSRAGAELEDGTRRDLTRAVGANGEGADPTLTHELLDSRSREGIWGMFTRFRTLQSCGLGITEG